MVSITRVARLSKASPGVTDGLTQNPKAIIRYLTCLGSSHSTVQPNGEIPRRHQPLRENIIIGGTIGLLFCAVGAVMTALAIKYATPGLLWDVILYGGVALIFVSISTLALYVSSQLTGKDFYMPAILVDLGICFIVGGLVWHYSTDLAPRQVTLAEQADQISPLISVIREYQTKLQNSEAAKNVIETILSQYDQVKNAINMVEGGRSRSFDKDRLAAAERLSENLRIAISRDVSVMSTSDGRALILRIAPNTFRYTGPVPMQRAPDITFPELPAGVTANITENSNLGFTVVFSPLSTPIERFPKTTLWTGF
jgi:hypothetical protein